MGKPGHLLEYTAEEYHLTCSSIPLGEYTDGRVGGEGTLVWGNPVTCSSIPLGEYTNGRVGGGGTRVCGNPVTCSSITQKYAS